MDSVKLGVKDIRILEALETNSRLSYSQLATLTGLSKQAVHYKVSHLIKSGVISSFLPIIDAQRLGYTFYNVFFQFSSLSSSEEQAVIDYLVKQPEVGWVVSTMGNWNLVIAVLVKDVLQFQGFLERLFDKYPDSFSRKFFQIIVDAFPRKKKYLYSGVDSDDAPDDFYYGGRESAVVDNLDVAILFQLSKDVRSSSLAISNELQVSPHTVQSRIKGMVSSGLIQAFSTKLNPLAYGYQWYFVLVEFASGSAKKRHQLVTALCRESNVVYIANAIGVQNMTVDFHVKDLLQLKQRWESIVAKVPDTVKSYEPLLIVKEHKCTFVPETLFVKPAQNLNVQKKIVQRF